MGLIQCKVLHFPKVKFCYFHSKDAGEDKGYAKGWVGERHKGKHTSCSLHMTKPFLGMQSVI